MKDEFLNTYIMHADVHFMTSFHFVYLSCIIPVYWCICIAHTYFLVIVLIEMVSLFTEKASSDAVQQSQVSSSKPSVLPTEVLGPLLLEVRSKVT